MTRANLDARRGGQAELTEAVERLVAALGGREAVLGSASETITATGWRHHPGWGTDPGTPEAVAEVSYTVVADVTGSRYRLALRGPTRLVPAELDYKGTRPFRVHIDPMHDGAEEVFNLGDRIRQDFFHRIGLEDLLRPALS